MACLPQHISDEGWGLQEALRSPVHEVKEPKTSLWPGAGLRLRGGTGTQWCPTPSAGRASQAFAFEMVSGPHPLGPRAA